MSGEIIAEKFALIRTRGGNGVAFTHLVEDTQRGERAVVKISDKLGPLTLEYLKTINLLRELELPGILLPYEGGILEEESGYYFAYPEVGQPSLENYLRIGIPLGGDEAARIIGGVLDALQGLHGAGYIHLFINTRNIFYQPRGSILLKDPALSEDFFHPLLEVIASPDFSYFSPEVMDGESPGAEADLYAVGRLAQGLLERIADAGTSPSAVAVEAVAERCLAHGGLGGGLSAAEAGTLLDRWREGMEGKSRSVAVGAGVLSGEEAPRPAEEVGGRDGKERNGRGMGAPSRILLVALFLPILFLGFLAVMVTWQGPERGSTGGVAAPAAEGSAEGRTAVEDGEGESDMAVEPDPGDGDGADGLEAAGTLEVNTASREEIAPSPGGDDQVPTDLAFPDSPPVEETAATSPQPPVASFSLSPQEGRSPLQVYLDASSSYDPDGTIVSYAWDFGGRGASLYHVFESNVIPASLSVTLTVTDDGGNSSSTTRYVTVY